MLVNTSRLIHYQTIKFFTKFHISIRRSLTRSVIDKFTKWFYNTTMKSSPSTAIDINEPFFKLVVFCFFLSFSSDLIDDGSLIHIYSNFLIVKPIKLFITGIL